MADYLAAAYGAVADGVTDCRPALSNAAWAAHQAGGGRVLLPAGDLAVHVHSGAPFVNILGGVEVVGHADGTRLHLIDRDGTGAWLGCFQIAGRSGLRDLTILREGPMYGYGLVIHGNTSIALDGITIDGGTDPTEWHGIIIAGSDGETITGHLRDSTIRGCSFGLLWPSERLVDVNRFEITDCLFEGQRDTDLEWNAPDTTGQRITIRDTTFRANESRKETAGFGVGLAGITDAAIERCLFDGYWINPIHIEDNSARIRITECVFIDASTAPVDYASHVFIVSGSTDIDIESCTFDTRHNTNTVTAVYSGPGGPGYLDPARIRVTGCTVLGDADLTADYAATPSITATSNRSAATVPATRTTPPAGGRIYRVGMAHPEHELRGTDTEVAALLDLAASTGATWFRTDAYWSAIEQAQGIHDWGNLDRITRMCDDRGMRVILCAHTTPTWARPDGAPDVWGPTTTTAVDGYANFCAAITTRYPDAVIELWNEPNLDQFWNPTPDPAAYAALIARAYPAIKTTNPGATVLTCCTGGALNPPDLDTFTFLAGVWDAGGLHHTDHISHHPYDSGGRTGGGLAETTRIKAMLTQRGRPGMQVWGTECGCTSGAPNSEAVQARAAVEAWRHWRSIAAGGPLCWYTVRDGVTDDVGTSHNAPYRGDGTAKPIVRALQQIAATTT